MRINRHEAQHVYIEGNYLSTLEDWAKRATRYLPSLEVLTVEDGDNHEFSLALGASNGTTKADIIWSLNETKRVK